MFWISARNRLRLDFDCIDKMEKQFIVDFDLLIGISGSLKNCIKYFQPDSIISLTFFHEQLGGGHEERAVFACSGKNYQDVVNNKYTAHFQKCSETG